MAKEKVFTLPNNIPKNQTELAESYGITKQTMNNYMRMAEMIPELEDLVDTGILLLLSILLLLNIYFLYGTILIIDSSMGDFTDEKYCGIFVKRNAILCKRNTE